MQSETRTDTRVKINTSIAGNVTKLHKQEPFDKKILTLPNYRQDAAKRQTASIKFTHRPKITFLAPQGRLVAPNMAGPTGT